MNGKVQQQMHLITATLDEGPKTHDRHSLAIVHSELLELGRAIHQKLDEGFHEDTFLIHWQRLGLEFREALDESRPLIMLPTPSAPIQRYHDRPRAKKIETPTPGLAPSRENTLVIRPDLNSKGDPVPGFMERSRKKRSHSSTHFASSKRIRIMSEPTRGYNITSKRFTLAEVRDMLRNAYTGVPNLIHPAALVRMIKLSEDHWREAAQQFLNHSRDLCRALVLKQVHQVFEHHQQSKYYQPILGICETFFEEAFASQRQVVQDVVSGELTQAYNGRRKRTGPRLRYKLDAASRSPPRDPRTRSEKWPSHHSW